jgi:hypothetical protein
VGVGKDNVYSFEPFVKTGCTGSSLDCKVKDIIYEWSVSPASTAGYSVYAVAMPNKDKRLRVKINKSGTLALSVKVTVTCGEGTTCTSTATKTFNVTAPEFWDVKRGPSGTPTTFNFPCGDRCDQTLPDIVHQKNDPLGGTIYSFEPKIDPICSSGLCAYQSLSYEWSFGPDSNAEYTLQAGTEKSKRLVVKITKGGTLELSVNVRVKCNNGTTCLVTGTRFFELIASVVIGPCTCACKFNTPAITFASGGGLYAFSPEVSTSCTGNYCQGQPSYSWSIGVGSTASYKIFADTDKTSLFGVTAMTAGKLEVVLTVAMKCEDGKTCSATTSKTFDVKP